MNDIQLPHRRRRPWLARALLPLICASLVVASALPADAQLDVKERKCRSFVATSVRKTAGKILKARAECISAKVRWAIGATVDCMADPDILAGDGTGDLKTDQKLAKVADIINRQSAKIALKCGGRATPLGAGLDALCTPAEAGDWAAVTQCGAIDIGKAAGDALALLLEVQRPVDAPLESLLRQCYFRLSRTTRFAEKKLNKARDACFAADDEQGGGVLECSATNAPPGIVQTTHSAKIDE